MFSSAQVEYVRYWLHEMGFTKNKLPLPSSEFLLTNSLLRNCTSMFIKNADELRKALNVRYFIVFQEHTLIILMIFFRTECREKQQAAKRRRRPSRVGSPEI